MLFCIVTFNLWLHYSKLLTYLLIGNVVVNNCYAALPRGAAICTALYLSVRPGLTRKQKVVETIQ